MSSFIIPISWACENQTAGSHISREAEVVSLDTGLKMEGWLSLTLWDIVTDVPELLPVEQGVTFRAS